MYSRADTQRIKQEFWIEFAEKYPRKWLLYDTKIKDFSFKFYADNKKAQVMVDIEMRDPEKRKIYFEKFESLKTILEEEFIADLVFERNHTLESGKTISRIWVEKTGVGVTNRNTWDAIFEFFNEKMTAFEFFFYEYREYIGDLDANL